MCEIHQHSLPSQNLILSAFGVHCIASTSSVTDIGIAHEAETERTTAVLVPGELGCERLASSCGFHDGCQQRTDCGLRILGSVELNNAGSARAAISLVLDLCLLHRADGGEEVDEILIACGPRKLTSY
jgi:hypothetical protein